MEHFQAFRSIAVEQLKALKLTDDEAERVLNDIRRVIEPALESVSERCGISADEAAERVLSDIAWEPIGNFEGLYGRDHVLFASRKLSTAIRDAASNLLYGPHNQGGDDGEALPRHVRVRPRPQKKRPSSDAS